MKIIFTDNELKNIYINQYSKYYNKEIINSYIKKIDQLKSMIDINDLYSFKSLNFEKLINYKKWNYSIRINNKWRLIFNILNKEIIIIEITELSNHYR